MDKKIIRGLAQNSLLLHASIFSRHPSRKNLRLVPHSAARPPHVMKKLVVLLLMAFLRLTYADSQNAHIYGIPPNSSDDDSYFIHITWLAAPGTPDGEYAVDMVYDGGAPGLFRNIEVSNGVCNPATDDYLPDPQGGHQGRVLYIGEGNHTWHWQGTHVASAEDAHLAVSWVQNGSHVVVQGNATITIGETATPTPSPSPTSDKPNDPHDGGNGADGEDENGGDHRSDPECTHGMARYTADLLTASLRITDTPLEYFPPVGPKIDFIIAYRQRDTDQSPAQQYCRN